MARDYKHAGRKKSKATRPPSRLAWFTLGLGTGLGLTVAAFVFDDLPELSLFAAQSLKSPKPAEALAEERQLENGGQERPRFEFYTILPEMEVAVSEKEIAPRAAKQTTSQDTDPKSYVLQAGSFRKFEEADRLKANLALLGLQSSIQTISVDGETKWHRVRVGPYTDLARLNKARDRIHANGIDVMVLKIRE